MKLMMILLTEIRYLKWNGFCLGFAEGSVVHGMCVSFVSLTKDEYENEESVLVFIIVVQ